MLKKILQVMLAANIIHKPELARRIGVQQETLDDMLRLLVERGLLRVGECAEISESHCGSCPSLSGCHHEEEESKSYYVTEKGRKYAVS
ncbi:MAG: FeoC-like transcriptional regulator [Candidatus Thorarchaeota archaeon]|jgi:predicted transcriptional regulator